LVAAAVVTKKQQTEFMQEIQPSLLKYIIIKQDESTFCRFKNNTTIKRMTLQLQQL
jgi:hypothetical protein